MNSQGHRQYCHTCGRHRFSGATSSPRPRRKRQRHARVVPKYTLHNLLCIAYNLDGPSQALSCAIRAMSTFGAGGVQSS